MSGVSDTSRIETAPLLPPFTPAWERMRSYYRLTTLPDGFPGRRETDGSVTPHPIYGTYVINDYAKQYVRNPTTELRDAITVVAHAAIDRMEPIEDGLAFYYEPEHFQVSRQLERHYSGLTQAYYAVALQRAFLATQDPRIGDAARSTFRSLRIPAPRGGVLYEWEGGVAIAEVPSRPKDMILNGWLSILQSIGEFADLSGDPDAKSLLSASTETLASLLPLYDVPELANSRYGLTGPMYARVKFGRRAHDVVLKDLQLSIPNEGELPIPLEPGRNRWLSGLTHPDEDLDRSVREAVRLRRAAIRLNVVISLLSHPDSNRVVLDLETKHEMPIALWANVGSYDPHVSGPVNRRWIEVDHTKVPAGRHRVALQLPLDAVHLAAYPTNFTKKIGGHPTNVYHLIHIKRLRELHRRLDIGALAEWADRWEDYALSWASRRTYRGLSVSNYFSDIPGTSIDLATYRSRVLRDRPGAS